MINLHKQYKYLIIAISLSLAFTYFTNMWFNSDIGKLQMELQEVQSIQREQIKDIKHIEYTLDNIDYIVREQIEQKVMPSALIGRK